MTKTRRSLCQHLKLFFASLRGSCSCSGALSQTQGDNMITGIDLIKKYEGFRSQAYKCPAGVWTIGYGSTVYADGSHVKKGDTISEPTAEALLTDYLIKNVRPHISNLGLTDLQTAALESLIYNIGWGAFSKSKCFKALKEKDWTTFFKEYDWFSAGGNFLPGLAKRRTEELNVFFSGM